MSNRPMQSLIAPPTLLPAKTDNNLYTATNRNRNYQRKRRGWPKILNSYHRARRRRTPPPIDPPSAASPGQGHADNDRPTTILGPLGRAGANATHQPAIHLPLVPFEPREKWHRGPILLERLAPSRTSPLEQICIITASFRMLLHRRPRPVLREHDDDRLRDPP